MSPQPPSSNSFADIELYKDENGVPQIVGRPKILTYKDPAFWDAHPAAKKLRDEHLAREEAKRLAQHAKQ